MDTRDQAVDVCDTLSRAEAARGFRSTGRRGARGAQLDGVVEDEAQWKSHNYNHLMEQPTIFYAIALTLALMDFGGGINCWLAWGYVGLRMLHSLIQATVNIVALPVRGVRSGVALPDRPDASCRSEDPPRLRTALAGEAGHQLDMGRPAELADRLDPFELVTAGNQRLGVASEGRRDCS